MKKLLFLFVFLTGIRLATAGVPETIVLKAMVVNPSETEPQTVPIELPPPREAGKKDVIEKTEELSIRYNAEQGVYMAVGEITLQPGEQREILVRIADIWRIPEK